MLRKARTEADRRRSSCPYRQDCHFYNIKQMSPNSQHLKELYCLEWPEKCQIHAARAAGRPVSITLWPAGKLKI